MRWLLIIFRRLLSFYDLASYKVSEAKRLMDGLMRQMIYDSEPLKYYSVDLQCML